MGLKRKTWKLQMPRQDYKVTVEVLDTIEGLCSPLAWCVRVEEETFGVDARNIYLPKSQVERDGNMYTMPQWLVEEKELEDYVIS